MFKGTRTDLASEARSLWQESAGKTSKLPGVVAREENLRGMPVTAVEILDDNGAKALGKPVGKYYTLELGAVIGRGAPEFPEAAAAVGELIARCFGNKPPELTLIASLGNPNITPDALGCLAAENVLVTRHLKDSLPEQFGAFRSTALCRTGVLGTTGIESGAQIKYLCAQLKPDCVIAIDALACSDISRLCRTVQISSSGIAPGSGVGNNREALNREYLGVPVIAVGMPTVIDAASLAGEGAPALFVTPRDIDCSVRSAAKLIGYGIDLALHDGLSITDIDMLVG